MLVFNNYIEVNLVRRVLFLSILVVMCSVMNAATFSNKAIKVTTDGTDKLLKDLSSVKGVTGVTFECWMKLPANNRSWTRLPMLDVGTAQIGFATAEPNNLAIYAGGVTHNYFFLRNCFDNKWHHFAVTVDFSASGQSVPGTVDEPARRATRIYVDGYNIFTEEKELERGFGGLDLEATVGVGDRAYKKIDNFGKLFCDFKEWTAGYTYFFDELRIWKTVRSHDDIRSNMLVLNESLLDSEDLVVYYQGNGDGKDLMDSSTRSNFSTTSTPLADSKICRVDSSKSLGKQLTVDVVQIGTEIRWKVDDESGIKGYHVVDARNGELLEVMVAGDSSYKTTIMDGTEVKVLVITQSL